MKILMLNYEFPPLGGGAARACENMLHEFAEIPEIKIDLVTSSVSKFKMENFSPNIRIFYLNIGKKGNLHYQSVKDLLVYGWKSYFFSRKLMRQNKYDLAHAFFGLPCGAIALQLGLFYIVSLRGSDVPFYSRRFRVLDKILFKNLSRLVWKKAVAVVANSTFLKDLALKTNPKQKIEIIPNGVDTDFFRPIKEKNKIFTILSTSRLIPRKGLGFLLDAFIRFGKNIPASRLIFAGSGPLEGEFKETANLSKISEKILFLGNQPKERMRDVYQNADVFVLPSEAEGMSNSMLEAMASGLGLVLSRAAAPAELVGLENAVILPEISTENIYNGLEKLFSDKEALDRMKIFNRQKAEKFSWTNTAENYLNIYKQHA